MMIDEFIDRKNAIQVRKSMRPDEEIRALAEFFSVLSDVTRMKIVIALSGTELCVSDLAMVLGMSEPAISHHLRILRHLRFVRYRRSGKLSYYQLDDNHVTDLLQQATEHLAERI